MPVLHLPYRFQAPVLRSRKHVKPVSVWLRGYGPVDVPEVDPMDMIPAVRIAHASGGWEVLHSLNGRLFRQAIEPGTGRPVDARTFEDAMSVKHDAPLAFLAGQLGPPGSVRRQFPRRGIRWNADAPHPLDAETGEAAAKRHGWKKGWSFDASVEHAAIADSQHFLSQAIVSVEGALHVAGPEPVWHVASGGAERRRVVLERSPVPDRAPWCFRLDRKWQAVAWSGVDERDLGLPEVEILSPDAIARDDDLAMAGSLPLWWERQWWVPFGTEPVTALLEFLDEARAATPAPRERISAALDAIERLCDLRAAEPALSAGRLEGDDALSAIAERRRMFRDDLSDDDLRAILGR